MELRPSPERPAEGGMKKRTIKRGPRVPLSEDPRMDRLDQILRDQELDRVEMLMDLLDQETAGEELSFINRRATDG